MANAVGIKVGDRETRDIADIFALTEKEYLDIAYCDPAAGTRDYKTMPEAEVLAAARAREATARFAWKPYMHDPRLKSRLHRIRMPTLFLWGAHDRMLSEAYGRAYCAMIPGARFETDRARRPFPASGAAGGIRREGVGVCLGRAKSQEPRHESLSVHRAALYPAWNDHAGSLRVNLPNRKCDPRIAADLFHRYYDEWQLADELGFDIMLNEHHQTATCMSSTVVVGLVGAGAHDQERAASGAGLSDRPPARSAARRRGALDHRRDLARPARHGLHQGRALRIPGLQPESGRVMERFWEAHDFIIKAMTTHDGPFNWEGEYFHYRQVNIWPRPWQQPHPPVWSTTGSTTQARVLGERGYVMATLGTGYNTRPLYDAYREGYVAKWGKAPGPDRFAYLGLVAVAKDRDEARRRGELVAGYLRSSGIVHRPFRNPPGFLSVEDNARMLRGADAAAQLHQGRPRHRHAQRQRRRT